MKSVLILIIALSVLPAYLSREELIDMELIVDQNHIDMLKEERELNDIKVAKIVLDEMGEDEDLLYLLSEGTALLLRELYGFIQENDLSQAQLQSFLNNEGKELSIWKDSMNPSVSEFMKVKNPQAFIKSWKLDHYQNFYRLYAAFFDYFANNSNLLEHGEKIIALNTQRNSYRSAKDPGSTEWDQREPFKKYKLRSKRDPGTVEIPDHVVKILGLDKDAVTGITMVTMKEGSVVKQIDKLFGLPEGADISGTTADILFSFGHMKDLIRERSQVAASADRGKFISLSELYSDYESLLVLLPLNTLLVYHHTFLEVLLVLSLNNLTEYSVGFYSSIFPEELDDVSLPDSIVDIKRRIREIDHANTQTLIYWENGSRKALILDRKNKELLAKFKEQFKINSKTYRNYTEIDDNLDGRIQADELVDFVSPLAH